MYEHFDVNRLLQYEAYQDFSAEDFDMIIEEGLKLGREVLGPCNQDGDREGARFEDGRVATPASFKEAWRVMAENGWVSITNNPEYGGQGLPFVVGGLISEFFTAANMAFMTYPGLTTANGRVIEHFGTDEDRALFCEKMYSGQWAGTMCLTEPDAGSDVGYLRSKAKPDPDSDDPRVYKIEGTKRFITCGEQDLTENIIHLVLARIEGAPMGTKGISLFIVPKIWVNPDGSLGDPNDVACSGIEHKMGIHGSATCTLEFGENGGCRGILLGEPHSGMAKMFQMMNEARVGCGVQALGLTAAAYDSARHYAAERVQGPLFTNRSGDRVRIIEHEDVRRMLLNLKAGSEAMRALLTKMFFLMDVAEHDPDEQERQKASRMVELLTPLTKAYHSDFGYELIRDAIQVLGGVGYCSEFPVEQYARDIKIVSIWEGTNYIQSLDLIGRKLPLEGGQVFQDWIQEVMDLTGAHKEDPELGGDFKLLFKAAGIVGDFAGRFMNYFQDGRSQLIPLNATKFLNCFAETELARLLLDQALIARDKLAQVDPDSSDARFYKGKIASAKHFCRNVLTNVYARHKSLEQEDLTAAEVMEDIFV
jgi:alkylation response protein AidB-like acyl-CoA dehydrogenase